MRFKGQAVWVRVDAQGRLALDPQRRAEMKYREEDSRSYRPQVGNLTPVDEKGLSDAAAALEARPRRKAASAAAEGAADAGATSNSVQIWTDGACSGNPGPMGIGMVVIANGKRIERGEYLGTGTNNIAELTAIKRGLELAQEAVGDPMRPARVHTDSGYAIGVVSKGWKVKANQELVARLRRMLAERTVTMIKVPGHAGVPENDRCDELARAAIARRASVP